MAKTSFSINQALHDAFGAYRSNWQLLLLGGALVSVGWLVDYHTVGHLQRIKHFVKVELPHSENAQEAVAKIKTFGRSLDAQGNHHESLLIWILVLYLNLGLARLCLQILGKGKASLQAFVTGPWDFLRYIGALCILGALATLFVLAMIAVTLFLKWFELHISIILLFAFILTIIFAVYMLHFIFTQYCAADKPKSVTDILKCSKNKACGNIGHLIGFVVIFHVVLELLKLILSIPADMIGGFIPVSGAAYFLVCMLVSPIVAMGYASVYRQIK